MAKICGREKFLPKYSGLIRMKKASTYSTIHTERLQNLQTSLSRFGVLLFLRLQRTGDKTYMQILVKNLFERVHIKDGELWKMVQ